MEVHCIHQVCVCVCNYKIFFSYLRDLLSLLEAKVPTFFIMLNAMCFCCGKLQHISISLSCRSFNYDSYNYLNMGGELYFGKRRAIQSKEETRRLFEEFHSIGHRGIGKTTSDLCSRFYWYGMSVDIEKWVRITFCL